MKSNRTNETRLLTPTVWKNSLASFFKIILTLVFLVFYVTSIMFFVFPQINVKLFRYLKIKPAEEASLVQVYEKTGKDSDLYNLIVFEQDSKSYDKELYYINLLTNKNSFDDFCEKLDASALSNIGENKTLIPYLCNTKGYLKNQKVKCLWQLNLSVESFIYSSLNENYDYEYSFATYVDFVNSNFVGDSKKQKYQTLLETFSLPDETKTVESLLDARIERLKVAALNETLAESLIRLNTLSNLAKGKYIACFNVYGEEDSKTQSAQQVYTEAANELAELI